MSQTENGNDVNIECFNNEDLKENVLNENEELNKNEDEDETPAKKRKIFLKNLTDLKEVVIKKPVVKIEKCSTCKQDLKLVRLYNGHPTNSNEEFIALTDEKLCLFTGDEEYMQEETPTNKLTNFSIYDNKGHLCPFDTGLIEKNVELFVSGYIKTIFDEDGSINDGIPAHSMGPILEWWTYGYDGQDTLTVGFTSAYGQYYFMKPSAEYQPIYEKFEKKIKLSKVMVEFLIDRSWENPSYEDLVEHINSFEDYGQVEDTLLENAQFLCEQVMNYDKAASSDDDKPLISFPCMRTLVKLAGVTFTKRKNLRKQESKGVKVKKGPTWSKATTTKLVRDCFENFFNDQIDKADKDKGPKKKRCGVCEACQSPDCGECNHCRDMLKFGGTGKSKQACKLRRCPNMAIADAEMSDNEEEKDMTKPVVKNKKKKCSKKLLSKVTWIGEAEFDHKGKKSYKSAKVGDIEVNSGDYVMLYSDLPNEPLYIAQITYMFEVPLQGSMFHAILFCRGADTILGETADPRELFVVDNCEDCPLGSIVRKAKVEHRKIPEDWSRLGGEIGLPVQEEDDGQTFFYTKRYDSENSRFVDFNENNTDIFNCVSCKHKNEERDLYLAVYKNGEIIWKNETYRVGTAVYLQPDVFKFKFSKSITDEADVNSENAIQENLYPEYYRKSDTIKGSNSETPDPFTIAIIEEIVHQDKGFRLKLRIFYRPCNLMSIYMDYTTDLKILFWSEQCILTGFENVCGKCYIVYGDNFENVASWSRDGPSRFYFTEAYDEDSNKRTEVPSLAKRMGVNVAKGSKGGKGKGKFNKLTETPPDWEKLEKPLKCMDVFAGCGGLSEGLHQAGLVDTKWAIEKEAPAAHAYRQNHPNCKVYTDDCNDILKLVMGGNGKERCLPQKGEVEILVGGPPCQGFSGMNRFNAGQYSAFKNSLVASYLSYADYYRPKYFVLENVRNFVSFKKSIVLKLTLRCLLAMGYQVAFGILQAGHYGVPQTRRRLIIMAAAPGHTLPKYPEPQHVFCKRSCQLSFVVDGVRYENGTQWCDSAPYRTICVRDAMSDLPRIKNGWSQPEMPYDAPITSEFQKAMRRGDDSGIVRDHICKEMAPIVEARITEIPTYAGADWRDLPNHVVKLKDGSYTVPLRYMYRTKKQKKDGPPKGVCRCASGAPCDPEDRQVNTLIPWCLPHTADRHNNWAALYGRLEWAGFFGTTITNPEPMGKQGRVLHPEQHRVVSVRECARSQGFPDRFKFFGNILDKHRQVGNAVPPPLAAALGREIKKAWLHTKTYLKEEEPVTLPAEDCEVAGTSKE